MYYLFILQKNKWKNYVYKRMSIKVYLLNYKQTIIFTKSNFL